jgi:pyruvate dehydrogenase E2 component (dihydrolipoamide acetyltransferase)
MSVSVTMPRLGESVTEGTVTRWLKSEGDHVDADEPLLEVSTDKVDTEIPSPASGTLISIKVQEDETVEIGVELAVIGDAAEAGAPAPAEQPAPAAPAPAAAPVAPVAPQPEPVQAATPAPAAAPPVAAPPAPVPQPAAAPPVTPAPAAPVAAPVAAAPAPPAPAPQPVAAAAAAAPQPAAAPSANGSAIDTDDDVAGTYVTPLVRKLAAENGVDLNTLTGTGVGGRIRKADVLDAAAQAAAAAADASAPVAAPAAPAAPAVAPSAPAAAEAPAEAATITPAPARGRVEKMSRRRRTIAARMVESLQVSAQLTTVVEVDVTKIARLRQQAKASFEAREGVKLSFLPFFAAAAVEALKVHPVLNASIDTEQQTITYHDAEHLGIAVDTEAGLTVPVIHDAGDLNLGGIARKIADLAERTRTNKISPDELSGGTFTLTNTGSRGALFDTPIINQPQVAILGTGIVVKRPVVVSDANLGETIAIRSMVYLALSYDHRLVDGADAARFLVTIKERLEAGSFERALGLA